MLIATGLIEANNASTDIFTKMDRYAKDWGLFSEINQPESTIPYTAHRIKSGFTFKSLFQSVDYELKKISYQPNEFLGVSAILKDSGPLIPATAYLPVYHEGKFYVLRTYKRSSGEFELHSYKLEDPDSWAPLNSLVITRQKARSF